VPQGLVFRVWAQEQPLAQGRGLGAVAVQPVGLREQEAPAVQQAEPFEWELAPGAQEGQPGKGRAAAFLEPFG